MTSTDADSSADTGSWTWVNIDACSIAENSVAGQEREPSAHPAFAGLIRAKLAPRFAEQIRAINGLRVTANVAIAYLTASDCFYALIAGSHCKGVTKPITLNEARFKGDGSTGQSHTEFQLLNMIASGEMMGESDEGYVLMYTELAPCASCTKVIRDFLIHFSNAKLAVVYSYVNADERTAIPKKGAPKVYRLSADLSKLCDDFKGRFSLQKTKPDAEWLANHDPRHGDVSYP